ncbi:hypothetical protein [Secundilactobacillus yichangensis]|nr:hypothetical protein [Secundilactobacillus yichangensis]
MIKPEDMKFGVTTDKGIADLSYQQAKEIYEQFLAYNNAWEEKQKAKKEH